MQINDEFNKLKENDIYSMILFCLYKLTNNKNYSTLSELAYTLDKDNFINLCNYFGGLTITIPKVEELTQVSQCLYIYYLVNIEHKNFSDVLKAMNIELETIEDIYSDLAKILEDYTFNSR